jgi:ubiquinone/menaquinone biosynthesis C-methylase UbiE
MCVRLLFKETFAEMRTDTSKENRMIAAFNEQVQYFQMMAEHHREQGGAALEPEVRHLMMRHARGQILDAGCGEGSIALWLAEQIPDTLVYGVDVSQIGIEMACRRKRPNTEFLVANLKQMPFPEGHFDFIYSQSVLEHIVGYRDAIKEWYRVLKPGGDLLIRVTNGGTHGITTARALWSYITGGSRVLNLEPSLHIGINARSDHQNNFDALEIPSDVLLRDLRSVGFRVEFFSTRFGASRNTEDRPCRPVWKRATLAVATHIPVFPFTHLGPTTIVLAGRSK